MSVWEELEGEVKTAPPGGILKRLIHPNAICNIYLGIDTISHKRMCMLHVPYHRVHEIQAVPRCKGFYVDLVQYGDECPDYYSVVISVQEAEYLELFLLLVDDIIEHIVTKPKMDAIVNEFIARLLRWQRFFDRYGPEGLGDESQRGLFGELLFLRDHGIPVVGASRAVAGWAGPDRQPHDFRFGLTAIEVKTTTSKLHQRLRIASELQLDDVGLDALLLFHLSLDVSGGAGETLEEVVSSIRHFLEDEPLASTAFAARLFEAGYLDVQASRYATKYRAREHGFFRVGPGFPRITEHDVPNGVGDVQYSIAVSECKHFSVAEADAHYLMEVGKHELAEGP